MESDRSSHLVVLAQEDMDTTSTVAPAHTPVVSTRSAVLRSSAAPSNSPSSLGTGSTPLSTPLSSSQAASLFSGFSLPSASNQRSSSLSAADIVNLESSQSGLTWGEYFGGMSVPSLKKICEKNDVRCDGTRKEALIQALLEHTARQLSLGSGRTGGSGSSSSFAITDRMDLGRDHNFRADMEEIYNEALNPVAGSLPPSVTPQPATVHDSPAPSVSTSHGPVPVRIISGQENDLRAEVQTLKEGFMSLVELIKEGNVDSLRARPADSQQSSKEVHNLVEEDSELLARTPASLAHFCKLSDFVADLAAQQEKISKEDKIRKLKEEAKLKYPKMECANRHSQNEWDADVRTARNLYIANNCEDMKDVKKYLSTAIQNNTDRMLTVRTGERISWGVASLVAQQKKGAFYEDTEAIKKVEQALKIAGKKKRDAAFLGTDDMEYPKKSKKGKESTKLPRSNAFEEQADPKPKSISNKFDFNKKQTGTNNVSCFNCHQKGHMARTCPFPSKKSDDKSGQATNNNNSSN